VHALAILRLSRVLTSAPVQASRCGGGRQTRALAGDLSRLQCTCCAIYFRLQGAACGHGGRPISQQGTGCCNRAVGRYGGFQRCAMRNGGSLACSGSTLRKEGLMFASQVHPWVCTCGMPLLFSCMLCAGSHPGRVRASHMAVTYAVEVLSRLEDSWDASGKGNTNNSHSNLGGLPCEHQVRHSCLVLVTPCRDACRRCCCFFVFVSLLLRPCLICVLLAFCCLDVRMLRCSAGCLMQFLPVHSVQRSKWSDSNGRSTSLLQMFHPKPVCA
jgi:hypothetical protein